MCNIVKARTTFIMSTCVYHIITIIAATIKQWTNKGARFNEILACKIHHKYCVLQTCNEEETSISLIQCVPRESAK